MASTPKSTSNNHASGDKRFKVLDITMKRNQHRQDALIEILHKAQESFGYLEEDVLIYIARSLKLPLSRVYGVATFYHLFTLKPSGKNMCVVCMGTACYVKGGSDLLKAIAEDIHLKPGQTTPDGEISLTTARCIGACGIAPAVVYNGEVSGKQTSVDVLAKLQAWKAVEAPV